MRIKRPDFIFLSLCLLSFILSLSLSLPHPVSPGQRKVLDPLGLELHAV